MRKSCERVDKFAPIKLKKSGRKGVSVGHNKRSRERKQRIEVKA